jgi:hypothetical protein
VADQVANTWVEVRTKVMKMLAEAKLAAELSPQDLDDIYTLEASLVEQARRPIEAMQQAGQLPPGGPGGMGGMMGGGSGMPIGPGSGVSPGFNVNEMARMLQQPQANFQ